MEQYSVYDELDYEIGRFTRSTTATVVLPPTSLGLDLMLSNRFSLGLSTVYQIHKEHVTNSASNGEIIDQYETKQTTTSFVFLLKYAWLTREKFHIGSAIGAGGSFLTIKGKYPGSNGSGVIDVHPIYFKYEVFDNWFINADVRIMNGSIDFGESGDVAAYNLGLGVAYLI